MWTLAVTVERARGLRPCATSPGSQAPKKSLQAKPTGSFYWSQQNNANLVHHIYSLPGGSEVVGSDLCTE